MYESFIGLACFICGILLMFAVHRVVFDHYASQAEDYIEDLKKQLKEQRRYNFTYEEKHTYAAPKDVSDLKFGDDYNDVVDFNDWIER